MAAAARVAGRGRRRAAPASRLGDAARAWDADARDPGRLYRGARLAAALDWAAGHDAELSPAERAFLDDSRSASGRAQRRLRMMLAGVAALLVLAVIAGLVALDQRGDARAEATTAAAQRLGAQALADASLDRGMLLARQGVALDDSVQTRGNLLATLLKSPAAIGVIGGDGDPLATLDLSRDGRTLALPRQRRDAEPRRHPAPGADRRRGRGFPASCAARSASTPCASATTARCSRSPGRSRSSSMPTSRRIVASLHTSRSRGSSAACSSRRTGATIVATIDSPSAGSAVTVQRFDGRDGRPIGEPRAVSPPRHAT